MPKNKEQTPPATDSIGELLALFDTHDMGDLWAQVPEAEFDIDIRRRKHLVALDDDLAGKLAKIARVSAWRDGERALRDG